jgi:hypothetical protein
METFPEQWPDSADSDSPSSSLAAIEIHTPTVVTSDCLDRFFSFKLFGCFYLLISKRTAVYSEFSRIGSVVD